MIILTSPQKVDEILELRQPLRRKLFDLVKQDLVGCVHRVAPFRRYSLIDGGFATVCPSRWRTRGSQTVHQPGNGEYHSPIPKLVGGAGDSWFPTRDLDTKYPWRINAGWNELLLRYDLIRGKTAVSLRPVGKPETLRGLQFSATAPEAAKH